MEKELLQKLEKSADAFQEKAAEIDTLTKNAKKTEDAVDQLLSDVKGIRKNGLLLGGDSLRDTFKKTFAPRAEELKAYKEKRAPIGFDIKAVGDIVAGSFTVSGTQTFQNTVGLPGIGRKPYENTHIRNILRVTPISTGDSIYVIRDSGGEGGPTSVAVGGSKPQSDRDWVKLIVPITKIAHHYRIPEEYLEDLDWLADEITAIGMEELLAKEDDMVLNNTTSGEFQGLTTATNSTAFSAPASLVGAIDFANNYDVLVAAWTQLRNLKSNVTGAVIHPSAYSQMLLTKSTTGEYPFGAPNIAIPNIFGVPIYPHTAMAEDKFLMGDFGQVAFAQRAGLTVRFYDQDRDNAIKNLVTVVIEERIAVASRRVDKLVYGDFSDAKASLNGGS